MITELRKNLGFITLAAVMIFVAHWVLQKTGRGGLGK